MHDLGNCIKETALDFSHSAVSHNEDFLCFSCYMYWHSAASASIILVLK